MSISAARSSAPMDDETRERDELRRVMPVPDEDAADELADALARCRFRAEQFGSVEDVRLDRYVLRRELGRGGMGVVFEAYDPILAIPVAIKLLQRSRVHGASEADLRLQREAQALATVRGEHVVQVFSAGFYMNQAWIAMEFVAGPNLGEWLRYQRDREHAGWRAVLPKFIDAARGLQSIHLAGLIHRDFKPQNAVVDPQGRVRVLDFGLATTDRRPVGPAAAPAAHLCSPGLTSTGELVGTTRYASPEQFVGTDLDHRSDQFSFCVALFEALWGHMPFGDGVATGKHLHEHDGPPIPRPTAGDVPGWLTSAVLRGLAHRPEQRFPDMAALLHELTRDRRRPYVLGGALVGSLLCGGLLAGILMWPPAEPDPLEICLSGQAALEPTAEAGEPVTRHVAAWRDAYATACQDTHRGRATDNLLARRQDCLARARKTFTALLARAPADARERLVGELAPPANCLDEGLGSVDLPRDPGTRERVVAVDEQLAAAEASRMLGNYAEAAELAEAAVLAAEASHHAPAVARARFAAGKLERLREHPDAAETALISAITAASRAGDHGLAIDAWHELIRLALLGEHAFDNATAYLRLADGMLNTVFTDQVASAGVQMMWARHADMRGLVAYAGGRLTDALAAHGEAITRWRQLLPALDVRGELAASLHDRGRTHSTGGDHTAALADHREALRLERDRLGDDHPSLAVTHHSLGLEHYELAELAAAEREMQRALVLDRAVGAARAVADDLLVLAKLAADREDFETAVQQVAAARSSVAGDPTPPIAAPTPTTSPPASP
jgi:tetratricopeptide (TPR) repeat protein/predicted Ser/Thr protein kinase